MSLFYLLVSTRFFLLIHLKFIARSGYGILQCNQFLFNFFFQFFACLDLVICLEVFHDCIITSYEMQAPVLNDECTFVFPAKEKQKYACHFWVVFLVVNIIYSKNYLVYALYWTSHSLNQQHGAIDSLHVYVRTYFSCFVIVDSILSIVIDFVLILYTNRSYLCNLLCLQQLGTIFT